MSDYVLLHVRDATIGDLAPAGLAATVDVVAAEDASSAAFRGLAARADDSGVLLASGAAEYLALTDRLAGLGREVTSVVVSDATDTFGFLVASAGVRRERVQQEGRVVQDTGEPLPEESGVDDLDEDAVLDLLEARTGADVDVVTGPDFVVLQPTQG